jgi:hypothetical protein
VRSSASSGGSPRRLFVHAGKWVLEVVRQVNVGQDLIRPTTERLTGQRAITSYFKNNPDKAQLGKATLRLMQSAREGETSSYTAEGSDWIANSMPPPQRLGSSAPPMLAPSLETVVSDLEARVVVLTAVQEGLLSRLARLEAKIAEGVVVTGGLARPDPNSDAGDADAVGGEPTDEEDTPSDDGEERARKKGRAESPGARGRRSAGQSVAEDDEGSEGPAEAVAEAPEAAAAPSPPAAPAAPAPVLLTLPPVPELAKCVALLIGGDVTAKEAEQPLPVNRTTRECYVAAIVDDNDHTVGLILMDLRATVFLGGTLMMLPRTEIEQQLRSLSPGEDSIAASAEICNALSGAINGFQDQHVRVGGLQKFEFKTWSWAAEPYERRDLEDSFGGRTAVISRAVQPPSG